MIPTRIVIFAKAPDCPDLTTDHLRGASAALNDHDTALIPTVDGGYALLALRRHHPLLFTDTPWSTDAVAFETLCRLGRLGWSVRSRPPLHDIDEPADLAHLPATWREDISACRDSAPPAT